jgi:hypothetical protein
LKGVPRTAISLMAARRNTVSDNGIRRRLTSLSPAAANQLAATRHGRRPRRGEQRAGWQSELVERVLRLQVRSASCTSVFSPSGRVIPSIGAGVPKVSSPITRQEIAVPYANINAAKRSSTRFLGTDARIRSAAQTGFPETTAMHSAHGFTRYLLRRFVPFHVVARLGKMVARAPRCACR